MEYSGQKRSNLLIAGAIWFFASGWIMLKAVPHQIPLKPTTIKDFYHYSLCFFLFVLCFLILACISRDRKLLRTYAGYAALLLIILMFRETEIERELLGKIRDYVVGFFLMPYWGWSRILEESTPRWIAVWCAISGAVGLFGARLSES